MFLKKNRRIFNKVYKGTFLSNFRNKMLELLLNKLIDYFEPYKVMGVYYSGVCCKINPDGTTTEKKFGETIYWETNFKNKEEEEAFVSQKKGPFYLEGKYFAVQNRCPHAGVGLAGGFIDGNNITCPGHGWQFDIKTGEHAFMPVCLRKYELKIEGEDVLIEI